MRRSPTETIRFLTLDETIRLFRAIGTHRRDRALFLVAYCHGLRASEVGLLRVEDLDSKALRFMAIGGDYPLHSPSVGLRLEEWQTVVMDSPSSHH
jgi:integrase